MLLVLVPSSSSLFFFLLLLCPCFIFSQGPKADAEILCHCRRTYLLSIAGVTTADFLVTSFGLYAIANSRVKFYVFGRLWNCSDEPIRVDSTETSLSYALVHSLTHSLTHWLAHWHLRILKTTGCLRCLYWIHALYLTVKCCFRYCCIYKPN